MTSIRVQRHASLAKPATLKPFHLRGTRNTLAHMRALCDSASVMQYVQQRQLLPGPELEVFEYEEGKLVRSMQQMLLHLAQT